MNILLIYCHPSDQSFTFEVKEAFRKGAEEAGHRVTVSDLYKMNFQTDLTQEEYLRETYYRAELPVSDDVAEEQKKIQAADGIVFLYPVFWTEAPAKLVGWFDRVWTSGFAYTPNPGMKTLDKALVIACAGKSMESLAETGEEEAMKTVMLGDRIRDRAREKEFVVLDSVTHWDEALRSAKVSEHLERAYQLGLRFGEER